MEKMKRKIDEDLLSFIAESRDLLEEMEPALISLGELLDNDVLPDKETVNLIFRGFHTIKGTAAFYQLDGIVSVAHKSETLLEYFRSGREEINATSTDILCHACDVIEDLFQQLETTGYDNQSEGHVRSVIHRLNGRIDLLRKKHADTLDSQEYLTDAMVASHMSASEKPKEEESFIAHKKIGQNTRIFVSECRQMMKDIDLILENQDWEKLVPANALDMCQVIYEGALFLGFEHLGIIVDHCIKMLQRIEDENKTPDSAEIDQIKTDYDEVRHIVNQIETTGTDLPLGNQNRNHDEMKGSVSQDIVPGNTHGQPAFTDDDTPETTLAHLFYEEAFECLNRLENHLRHLKHQQMNPLILSDARHEFHQIKGNAGMADQGDLEWLSEKAEKCLDEALDDSIVLDDWDIRALWYVVSEMKSTLSKSKKDQSDIQFKKAALAHILDQITSGKQCEDKERDIHLPDVDAPAPHQTHVMDDYVNENDTVKEVSFPLPESLPENDTVMDEKITEEKKDLSSGFLWGGEKRKSERRDIRVSIDKLDELINLVGELVIAENMVVKNSDVRDLGLINFEKAGAHLRKIVRDLQDVALAVRMVPISGMFRKMIRLVHDLSLKSGKKISLKLIGEDTEIDKTVAELISDPLVHLVRNAIDHGIEKKVDRREDGLDGRIILEARHEGGEVLVIVRDNGKGLDMQKIMAKAKEVGILSRETGKLSDNDMQNLIFHPGFSTQDTVTDLSGRGVGMDVVKKNMEKVKGRIHVFSQPQQGTTFVLRIPLTLAIIEGMLVRVGEASYTIPLLTIRETVQVSEDQITLTMDGQEMVNLRGNLIPVIRIHDIYNLEPKTRDLSKGLIVVVEHHYDMAGLFIDSIVGEQQTVIKGLSGYMKEIHGISGCTILGDGEVSLILDVAGLIHIAKHHEGPETSLAGRN